MHVVRFAEAPEYTAPGHHDMAMVRLQGREAGPSSDLWVGVSVIAPGGGTMLSSSAQEKMYVVLNGTLVHLERRNQDRAQKMGFLPHWQATRPPPDQLNEFARDRSSGDAALGGRTSTGPITAYSQGENR